MFPMNVAASIGAADAAVGGTIRVTDPGSLFAETGMNFTILPAVPPTPGTDLPFPRIGVPRIAERTYAQDDADGENDRDFIARGDVVVIGLFADGPWDRGDPGILSRSEIYQDLKARNPNLVIFDYQAVMEGSLDGIKGTKGQAEIGPLGGGGTWQPNDWIGRDTSGNPISTFPGSANLNITDYVTADAQGRKYPQFIFEENDAKHMVAALPVLPGIDGCNLFFDVYDRSPLTDATDFNRDNQSDGSRSNYNPFNPGHDPLSVEIAGRWRQGYRDVLDFFQSKYPIVLEIVNFTTHSQEYQGTDMSEAAMPELMPEYIDSFHGGWQEGQTRDRPSFTFSRVASDGLKQDNDFGNWQMMQNAYVYGMYKSTKLDALGDMPKYVLNQYEVDIVPTATNNPGVGTAFNLARWAIVSTLLDDGYITISGAQLQYGTSIHFDEYGTINQGVTGLTKGHLGAPLDAAQRIPWTSTLWKRRFEGGIVIINTDFDETNASKTVPVTSGVDPIGAGIYKRITGSQDPGFNDGSVVNANFQLNPIDAIVLELI